jgi:branched-chain amino acid transport system permease protein
MGINNNFIISLTFVVGSALAAVGVIIYLLRVPFFTFELGSATIGLYPFVSAVIGGIGSLPGAVLGGFLIGVIKELAATFEIASWSDAIVYGIFVVILLFKPAGLLGKDIREKV